MKTFHCDHCGHLIFFENTSCGNCGHGLGYSINLGSMVALEAAGDDLWRGLGVGLADCFYRKCRNYAYENVCNWMLRQDDPNALCLSCRLTEIVPTLSLPVNRNYWYRLESAKRRLLYTLLTLGLPIIGKNEDPAHGLSFQFLADMPGDKIRTGHLNGVITINIAEADDSVREKLRADMGEPYRTLLGHFRHEIGHYYWEKLVAHTAWIDPYRQMFGDERNDYAMALQRYHDQGPSPNWRQQNITAYASAHSWEDWAETWAHYLHMLDTLETAYACGMALLPTRLGDPALNPTQENEIAGSFQHMIDRWFPLTYALNSLNRSLGLPDAYPFALTTQVIGKLRLVRDVVMANRTCDAANPR